MFSCTLRLARASHAINGEFPEAVNRRILILSIASKERGKQMTSQNGWHYPYVAEPSRAWMV